jgi:Cu(I)/Ag(I) efflux system membrane protein CusA/SilA
MQQRVSRDVQLPAGYSISWSGQYEYLERAAKRLQVVVPATLTVIFLLLFVTFRNAGEALLVMGAVPFALTGGVWLIFLLDHHLSVASMVGFIALAGVAAEFGVVMLVYLRNAWERRMRAGAPASDATLAAAIEEGAVQRTRPKAMTVAVIFAGLLPIMLGGGTGAEVMQRIAAPMVGGMVTAPLLSLLVIPAAWMLMMRWRMRRRAEAPSFATPPLPRSS